MLRQREIATHNSGEIPALTSARFVAAFGVLWYHYGRATVPEGPLLNIVSSGYSGVSFFFVLSGFILTYVYHAKALTEPGQLPNFYLRRFARIYPVYLVAWLLFGISFVVESAASPAYIAKNVGLFGGLSLALMQSWVPGAPERWNWPGWSLSVEAVFYALFPLLLTASARLSTRAVIQWLVAALFANAIWQEAIGALMGKHMLVGSPLETPISGYLTYLPLCNLSLFITGIAVGRLYLSGVRVKRPALWLSLVAALTLATLAAGASPADSLRFVRRDALLAPEFAALIYLLASVRVTCESWAGRASVLLGRASYALYIIQVPAWNLTWWLVNHGNRPRSLDAVSAFAVIAVGLSILVHLGIEVPAERAIKQWWKRRRKASVSAIGAQAAL